MGDVGLAGGRAGEGEGLDPTLVRWERSGGEHCIMNVSQGKMISTQRD